MKYFLISLCILSSQIVGAFHNEYELILKYSDDYGIHYVHTIKAKETIYSLAKAGKTSVSNIYQVNDLQPDQTLAIGQVLIIPVNPAAILAYKDKARNHNLVKVFYEVKKKENLFQIAKRYFNIDIDAVKHNNSLQGDILSPGQMLHIGWLEIPVATASYTNTNQQLTTIRSVESKADLPEKPVMESISEKTESKPIETAKTSIKTPIDTVEVVYAAAAKSYKNEVSKTPPSKPKKKVVEDVIAKVTSEKTVKAPPVNKETTMKDDVTKVDKNKESKVKAAPIRKSTTDYSFLSSPHLITKKGMALWDKGDNEPLNLFVLHKTAKTNSFIRIENPMLKRVVVAKVIGPLPANVYGPEIEVLVSTAVAKSLGVMDSKFLAVMKYLP